MNGLQALFVMWKDSRIVALEYLPSVSGFDISGTADSLIEEKREAGVDVECCGVFLICGRRLVWVGDRN